MDIHGIHGYSWISIDIYRYPRMSMEIMVIKGHPWISMDIHGYAWISMDIHGHPYPYDCFSSKKPEHFVCRTETLIRFSRGLFSVITELATMHQPLVSEV